MNNDTWIYSISDGVNMMCFMTVEMVGIIDMGDSYNIVFNNGELFVGKDCFFSPDKIEYKNGDLYICLERDIPKKMMPMAS